MKKTLTVLLMVLLAAVLMISCDDASGSSSKATYSVSFQLGEGKAPTGTDADFDAQDVVEGEYAKKPATNPTANDKHQTFKFWSADDGATEFNFDEKSITEDIVLKAYYRDYVIGDTGPAGGIIFYINASYNENSSDNNWKYMEIAPSGTSSKYYWSAANIIQVNFTTETGIGKGKTNTNTIKNQGIDNYPAAKACVEYGNGTNYTDWFMPSKDEVVAVRTNICTNSEISAEVKALFPTEAYWTSSLQGTTTDSNNAVHSMACYEVCTNTNGNTSPIHCFDTLKVRPVRSF